MSGLFHSLTMATRSLQAQQYALNVTGQNISNVNTPGYARRVVDFAAVPPDSGGGVEIARVHSMRDALIEKRLLQQSSVTARDTAMADALSAVEGVLGTAGNSIDGRLDELFSAFANLANDPTSSAARRQVQSTGQAVATSFADMAEHLESARRNADSGIGSAVDQINALASQVADINAKIPAARLSGDAQALEDQQTALVNQLSQLVDVHVISRQQGGVDLTIGNGRALVAADNAYTLTASPTMAGGYQALTSQGVNVTGEIAGGALGGLLTVRDVTLPGYQTSLDTLASTTVAQVNALHTAGFDLDGAAGGSFFSYSTAPVGVTGAARAMRLDPAIAGNARTIAAASVAESGDNGAARNMAALRTARVANGNTATLVDSWGDFVNQVGSDARNAQHASTVGGDIVREVEALRDQVSGVSLDEEAMNLLKFQRAYEANARFFTTVDGMLSTLLNMVAR